MKALKPCPFCGGMPEEQHKRANGNVYWHVGCYDCLAEGPYSINSMDEATEAWNTRYPADTGEEAEG